MAFRSGFVLGLGVGYVLGTRAGRERYEQIRALWHQVSGSPAVQRAAEKAKEAASSGTQKGFSVIQSGVERGGTAVKARLRRDDDETTWTDGDRTTPGNPGASAT
jgi:methylase of polypeptide subunit release factors